MANIKFTGTDSLTVKFWSKMVLKEALKSTMFSKFAIGLVNCDGCHKNGKWMRFWYTNGKINQKSAIFKYNDA